MENGSLNVTIGGEAGQGLVTVGTLLAKSLVRSGYFIVGSQSYYSRVRGGHNTFSIRASANPLSSPTEVVDLLVALDEDTISVDRESLDSEGILLADEAFESADDSCLRVPYKELAEGRYVNIAVLGVVGYILGLQEESIGRLLDERFKKKDEKAAEKNRHALSNAYKYCVEQSSFRRKELPRVLHAPKRLMLDASEAISLAAMSSGVKFCSFYPMTPSTAVPLNLVAHGDKTGIVVEQAEDEIAAINMAIGASFAGAPSMVATSGGGFALMVEAISLAGVTETPVVVVLGQRPGPATGLPTRTEQGDLEIVLHSGHGEYPRPTFTPGTLEECFHLTRKAFDLAERYQGPAFLLMDQFLADSYRAIEPFDLDNLSPVRVGSDPPSDGSEYRRYAFTENGISPRLLPGKTKHLVKGDSHEHTETGHITEDPEIRKKMVDKRLKKEEGICKEVVPPDYEGDDKPDLLFVTWGSTVGVVAEVVTRLQSDGKRVGQLHFSQVWPLAPEQFLDRLEEAGEVICVEGNATGQFARLIRRETGFFIPRHIRRYDGRPFTPEWILRELNA